MSSKRKNRQRERRAIAKEYVQKVIAAIRKLRVDITRFFENAAKALQVSKVRAAREADKFKRVHKDGIDNHRGYKIPQWALAFADQVHSESAPA